MKEITITPKEIEGCINDLLDAKENYKTAYENVMTANKMLEKKLDEMTQYACDLEDKICYLNGDWNKLKEWLIDLKTPKIDNFGDRGYMYMLKIDVILDKMNDIKEEHND